MTTHTIQTSQHTHKCAPAPVQLLPRGAPAAEEPLTTRLLPLPDLQRLALLAARIAQLVELLLQSADEVGACAHSIGLGFSSMEACRDEGGLVGGEGEGVGVLSAPEAAGPSTTVVLQPLLRSAGIMLKISNLLPKQLLRRCGRRAAVGCDAAGCFAPGRSSTMRARALARKFGAAASFRPAKGPERRKSRAFRLSSQLKRGGATV